MYNNIQRGRPVKHFSYLVFVGLVLAACSGGGTPSVGTIHRDGFIPGTKPYADSVIKQNQAVTNMLITNTAQAEKYITSKLVGYSGNTSGLDKIDVANLAIKIASGGEISDADAGLVNPALYLIDAGLYSACANQGETCISNWRDNNSGTLKNALGNLQRYAEVLDIKTANFTTLSSENVNLTFSVNDSTGAIESISVGDNKYQRVGATNTFNNGSELLTYKSAAGADMGLRYSDFGYYNITDGATVGPDIMFAGGYGTKQIAESEIKKNMTDETMSFRGGAAIGTLTNNQNTESISANNVSLVFNKNDGSSVLTVPFTDWYTITATKNFESTNATIDFSEPADDSELVNMFTPSTLTSASGNMNVGYYGPSGTPTEATGTVQYTEPDGMKMDVAFGIKK